MNFLPQILLLLQLAFAIDTFVTDEQSNIEVIAHRMGKEFENIKNEELGAVFTQKLYEKSKYTATNINARQIVQNIAQNVEAKINNTFSALIHTRTALDHLFNSGNITHIKSSMIPCLEKDHEDVDANLKTSQRNIKTDSDLVFEKLTANMWNMKTLIKRRYLILTSDIDDLSVSPFDRCTYQQHSSVWRDFINRYTYNQRNVILILDNGNSVTSQQFNLIKAIGKEIVENLNAEDNLAVIAVSASSVSPHMTLNCSAVNSALSSLASLSSVPNIVPVTENNRKVFNKFIDLLSRANGNTRPSIGFEQALKAIELSEIKYGNMMILYVTNNVAATHHTKRVLEIIASGMKNLSMSLVVNTCFVVEEPRDDYYENDFLRDITNQDYQKYNMPVVESKPGFMLAVSSTNDIGFVIAKYFSDFGKQFDVEKKISLPIWDNVSKDLTISLSLGCYLKGIYALVGVDLYFPGIAEDITYLSVPDSYAFMTDIHGTMITHPLYPRPVMTKKQPNFVNIHYIEKGDNFGILWKRMLTEDMGIFYSNSSTKMKTYAWSKICNWYIVCVVMDAAEFSERQSVKVSWLPGVTNYNLFYHHLERNNEIRYCRHLHDVTTLDASSLYLSPSCFNPPSLAFKFLKSEVMIQDVMQYLKDDTDLTTNPGLKEGIKDDVTTLAHIIEYLRTQHLSSANLKYILRKYVISNSGVLQMFPGTNFPDNFEPSRTSWFLSAKEHTGNVIFTPPYLDNGGGGFISTIAYSAPHVMLVMDITYGYVLKLLLKVMPTCNNSNITCFIVDDRGYLIYHPNLIDLTRQGPVEQFHIVHKESLVANDILNHQYFVKKNLCTNYADGTLQRHYQLNTSFTKVLFNYVPGEHCVTYKVNKIPNTNLFLGIVNATCEVVSTFCPCSVVDRLCLNCNRMEQKECECPCECPLNYNLCHDQTDTTNSVCTWLPETYPVAFPEGKDNEKSCFPITCEAYTTFTSCLGVIGCEWCKYDTSGLHLSNPFCGNIAACFNGVIGSQNPYLPDATVNSSYSPIGPILGFLLAVCILITLFFVCFRLYLSQNDRVYLSSTQDNHMRMSDLNISDNYHNLNSHRDKLLPDEKPVPFSPYCVTSNYRKTVPAADSDHGYSTMTPHDESEQLSLAPIDIDQDDDFISDSTSLSTNLTLKHRNKRGETLEIKQFTQIPNKNCIVVPVTVHRNMEVT